MGELLQISQKLKVVRGLRNIPKAPWDRFVDHHPESTIFHTRSMSQVFSRARGLEAEVIAVFDGDTIITLLAAVQNRMFGNLLPKVTSRTVVYGGLLFERTPRGLDGLRLVTQDHDRHLGRHTLFTEVRNASTLGDDLDSILDMGWTYEPHLNYILETSAKGLESTWSRLGTKCRNNLRRAKKKGVELTIAESDKDLDDAYRLLENTYSRARVPLADISLFRTAFSELKKEPSFEILLARYEGKTIGTRFQLYHRDKAFDWYAGSDPTFRNLYPNDLLVWEALERASKRSMKTFDFGGAGHPDEPYGVRDFKSKWNGQLVEFGRLTRVHAPSLLNVSKTAYSILRGALAPRLKTETSPS